MKHGSLFSGIGGWSVASDQMNWSTAFMCEWDENKQYILKHHWLKAEIYGDITKTDFKKWRGIVNILTASTPCQPFSVAGKREGANDLRHLWPETHRAIREIQPQWFVLENVPGLVNWSKGMVFKQIISDLENEGYEVLPFLLPACGVNAPHKRERIWIIAYRTNPGIEGLQQWKNGVHENKPASDPNCNGHKLRGLGEDRQTESKSTSEQEQRERVRADIRGISEQGITADPDKAGYKGDKLGRTFEPNRIKPGRKHKRQSFESITQLHKTTNWLNFPTVSPLRTGDDGFSRDALRSFINENSSGLLTEKEVDQIIQKSLNKWNNETIAAGGDAVVPGVVLQIFKAIEQVNNNYGRKIL